MSEPFAEGTVRGFLHSAAGASRGSVALGHGAGSNARAPVLVTVAAALAEAGFTVLRFDLPFRQARPSGPPWPAGAPADQEGIRAAAGVLRRIFGGRVFLGGHSYGGRQSTMLAAADPGVADGLLLLSYPLHPPKRPQQLRTEHFPRIVTPAAFLHGSRDPFGTLDEMRAALALIPAPAALIEVKGAGHDLKSATLPELAVQALSGL
ncbi:MAG TPA: alpha/beta family hydrolase [Bryobacteraceae bacterium]|nr:alpha/beta family hydrolase [Bryobacteraceae bacterium]